MFYGLATPMSCSERWDVFFVYIKSCGHGFLLFLFFFFGMDGSFFSREFTEFGCLFPTLAPFQMFGYTDKGFVRDSTNTDDDASTHIFTWRNIKIGNKPRRSGFSFPIFNHSGISLSSAVTEIRCSTT